MEIRTDSPATADTLGERQWWPWPRRIVWGAIFGGLFLGLGILITLVSLGAAVGISVLNPFGTENARQLAISQVIWWIFSVIVAMFFAGWAAARLSGLTRRAFGALNALISWGLLATLLVYAVKFMTLAALSGGQSLPQTGSAPSGAARQAAAATASRLDSLAGQAAGADTARPVARLSQKAGEKAGAVKKAATGLAWAAFLTLLLGGLASWLGGVLGTTTRTDIASRS
jgi:hypothetical protein